MPPAALLRRLLRDESDIQAVWSVGHSADADMPPAAKRELLIFAGPATLERLRKSADARESDVSLLVVTDGDAFENAWGAQPLAGSLARWGWREGSPGQAFYDESRWVAAGGELRVRRKALLLWRRPV